MLDRDGKKRCASIINNYSPQFQLDPSIKIDHVFMICKYDSTYMNFIIQHAQAIPAITNITTRRRDLDDCK